MSDCKLPYGKLFNSLGKLYFGIVNKKLAVLDIDRCFYPLHLIIESKGGISQCDLGDLIGSDKATTTRHIDYLVKMGYVVREINPEDRREVILKTTPKADLTTELVCSAFDEVNAMINELLSEQEPERFLKTLMRIEQKLTEET